MLIRRLNATVEASTLVLVQILIGNARITVFSADDRVITRPELESDNITRQGVDTVWREVVSRVAD